MAYHRFPNDATPPAVNRKMLIESDPHETRIAILEDDRLTELFIERAHERGIVGNVYRGRVHRILPGMQAAFVDLGLARDAFLYVDEVSGARAVEEDDERPVDDDEGDATAVRHAHQPSIDELLAPGQEVIVQVLKDPMPSKGARVSTQVTLPGRFLVLLPDSQHIGISRRIEDEAERDRLRTLLAEIRPAEHGLIVRTAGVGAGRDELVADIAFLTKLWERIRQRAARAPAPSLVHRDLDVVLRVVRDTFGADFEVLMIEGEEAYERVVDFVDQVEPTLIGRVKLYEQETALFERFAVDAEIAAALESKVWLKSGGYLVIHPTEALVAIDVNTGRFVGSHALEDTVLQTNLEAVAEVVRQLRLRNLGGIVVIDLIDMEEEASRQRVFAALEEELTKDRARNRVLSISEFGLVELTRKRTRPSLERLLTQSCPYCQGTGRVRSPTTMALEIRRQVLRHRRRFRDHEVLLRVHPDVAETLQREERALLDDLERTLGSGVVVQSDPKLHHERFDILEI